MMTSRTSSVKDKRSAGRNSRLQFRDTPLGVLPNSIEAFGRLTLDAASKVALTQAGCKLLIELDSGGTRVMLVDARNGQMVGGPDDLAKLGGIRSFITREKKESHGVEIAKETSQVAYKASIALKTEEPGYVQPPLDTSFGASIRPLLTTLERLDDNEKKLKENNNPSNAEPYKALLGFYFKWTKKAYFDTICRIVSGKPSKGYLAEMLFEYGVPEYIHNKIIGQSFVLDRSQELIRVLFPSDPSKGIAFTLKEYRSGAFIRFQNVIMANSMWLYDLVNNDRFIRVLTRLDETVSLSDETNPVVQKLLKTRIVVIPPDGTSALVTEPGSKGKGWKFPSPSMDTPQGALSAFSAAVLRIYAANLQSVDLVNDYYQVIVPDTVSRAAVTPTNNFYVQWANADDPDSIWSNHIKGGVSSTERQNVWRWLRMEMRLSEKGTVGTALAKALKLGTSGQPLDPNGARLEEEVDEYFPFSQYELRGILLTPPKITGASDLLRPLTDEETLSWKKFQAEHFPSKKGKRKDAALSGNPLTRLSPQGKELVAEVELLSPYVAERMRVWLRSFSDDRLQIAAVRLANASFDQLFLENEEEDDAKSVEDWADEEED